MINNLTIKNSVKIIDHKYVIKKKQSDIASLYQYLNTREFYYYPKIIKEDSEYIYYEYIISNEEPMEEKLIDLISLLSLLHNKTTYYKEVDIDYYKDIYERIDNKINDTYKYYNNLMNNIEKEIYMSPANYLIARNITSIYESLNYAKTSLTNWYKLTEGKRKVRIATIHNNLSLEHYLKSAKPYFISWDKSKEDMPLYDLVKLYQSNYLEYDYKDILKRYFNKYPYQKEEIILFLTLISIPNKITNYKSEWQTVLNVRRIIDYIYKTKELLSEYRITQEENKSNEFQKQN